MEIFSSSPGIIALNFLMDWWWVLLPVLFYRPFLFLWLYRKQEVFASKQRSILLELKAPPEVLKPIKAMENVFAGLWQFYDPANPREKWLEGKYQLSFSIEIVSTEGEVHFYLRIPEPARRLVESALYAQYPAAELHEVEDYTQQIPRDIPNKEWDLWGLSYTFGKPNPYPIKTYASFFEEGATEKEEVRIDPITHLVEALSKCGPGEHVWIQMVLWPITTNEYNYVKEGNEIVAKLVRRQPPPKPPTFFQDLGTVSTVLMTGQAPSPQQPGQQDILPPEMRITPGEREIVSAIERKISKYAFLVAPRFVYLAKRDSYFGAAKALPMSYFTQFSTATFNQFLPLRVTITKVHTVLFWLFDARRLFVRKRRLMRNYIMRMSPFFPNMSHRLLLNIEELATIFHLPGRITAPSFAVPRVEAKKGEPPPTLPTE